MKLPWYQEMAVRKERGYRLVNNIYGPRTFSPFVIKETHPSTVFDSVQRSDNRRTHSAPEFRIGGLGEPFESSMFYLVGRPTVYPKEPQKTDPVMLSQGVEQTNKTYRLQNYHQKDFQPVLSATNDPVGDSFKRKQHFIKGQIPGGSRSNRMIYGTSDYSQNNVQSKNERGDNQKPVGFMYGSNAATNVGQSVPGTRPNNALFLEQRNQSEEYKAKLKKLQSEKDEYLARYYEDKEKRRVHQAEEKKKEYERLATYKPFETGPGGGGAPRKHGDVVDARFTKNVQKLNTEEAYTIGGQGGGAPTRTESGKLNTKLRSDPALQFPVYGDNTVVNQQLRFGARGDRTYKQDLDKIVEDTKAQKQLERKRSFEEECKHNDYFPFGKQGGGAPLKDEKGNLKTGHPITLSGDSVELRGVEGRHDHAYSQKRQAEEKKRGKDYEPWGKGFGNPVRDQTGRVFKQGASQTSQSDDLDGLGFPVGKPGAGAPIKNAEGKLVTKRNQTLVKDTHGNAYPREFSPKNVEVYDPWGKPGHGNRITNEQGKVVTQTAGKVQRDTLGRSPTNRNKAIAKQELRNELLTMAEEAKVRKRREREDMFDSGGDVATWVKAGSVGQPRIDPVTKEVVANPRGHSDITLKQLNINRPKNESSYVYHRDLELQAKERKERRMRQKEQTIMEERKHVETFADKWGRPGAGAPLDFPKRKVDIAPAEGRNFFRPS